MERIASFEVNHDLLERGIYTSRIDGDAVTYDIRLKKPNGGDYMSTGEMHTIEHIFATYVRNSKYSDRVLYVGPMGCQTGFYLLVRDSISETEVIELIKSSFSYISEFEGTIPGSTRIECGNCMDHDLEAAKRTSAEFLEIIHDWTPDKLKYAK